MPTTLQLPPVLKGPYSTNHKKEDLKRLNGEITLSDWALIRCVCPLQGTTNAVIGTIFHHIANELRRRNITEYNPNVVLAILHECTDHGTPKNDSSKHDPYRAPGIRPTPQGDAHVPADPSSAATGRVGQPRGRSPGGGKTT